MGFHRAGLSVSGPTSLAISSHLLLSVTAFHTYHYTTIRLGRKSGLGVAPSVCALDGDCFIFPDWLAMNQ